MFTKNNIMFGNLKGEEPPKKGFINIKDPKLSPQHFQIEMDAQGNGLNIIDLGSDLGTWLVVLNYLEDQILPEIEYQNPRIGAFKFELGVNCFNLEEVMEMYQRSDVHSDLCTLEIFTLKDLRERKTYEIEGAFTKYMVPD